MTEPKMISKLTAKHLQSTSTLESSIAGETESSELPRQIDQLVWTPNTMSADYPLAHRVTER